ncbi:unnamed protein product, partial [Pelagomonas calceolata]
RRVELNLGGRKGTERKVLGLGLGARISRRGVRAHEVGRHLHAEDEGDEGRARHGALEDLVAGRGHGRVVGPVREVVVVRQVHLRLARGARRRRRGRRAGGGRCRVLLDRGQVLGDEVLERRHERAPRPVEAAQGRREDRAGAARLAQVREGLLGRAADLGERGGPPVGADRGGDAAQRRREGRRVGRVRGRRRVVGGRRRHLRLGHLAREERPAGARRGRADGALAQRAGPALRRGRARGRRGRRRAGAAQGAVRVRRRVERGDVAEEVPELRRVEGVALGPVLDDGREALLRELALVDLLLDRPRREEAVGVAGPRVAVAPAPRGRLLVHGRVPGRVEEDEAAPADQVQAAAARRRRQQEAEVVPARRVVEAVRELLALLGRRAAVQQAPGPALADAQPRHQGQGLRLRRDDDAPLVRGRPELPQQPEQDVELGGLALRREAARRRHGRHDALGVAVRVEQAGVVADLLQLADRREHVRLLAPERVPQPLVREHGTVGRALRRRRAADDDLHELARQVRRVQAVLAAEEEPRRDLGEDRLFSLAERDFVGIRAPGQPRGDGPREAPPEGLGRAQDPRVREVGERVELLEVVLEGRAREEDASFGPEGAEGPGGLRLPALEALGLVADEEVARRRAEARRVRRERLVGDDEHLEGPRARAEGRDRFGGVRVDGLDGHALAERRRAAVDPLVELGLPVRHEGAGARHDDAPERLGRGRDRAVPEERVDERHGLERLPEAHVVREDGAVSLKARVVLAQARDAVVEEPHALALVRAQELGDERRHAHGPRRRRRRRPGEQRPPRRGGVFRALRARRPEHEGLVRQVAGALARRRRARPPRHCELERAAAASSAAGVRARARRPPPRAAAAARRSPRSAPAGPRSPGAGAAAGARLRSGRVRGPPRRRRRARPVAAAASSSARRAAGTSWCRCPTTAAAAAAGVSCWKEPAAGIASWLLRRPRVAVQLFCAVRRVCCCTAISRVAARSSVVTLVPAGSVQSTGAANRAARM